MFKDIPEGPNKDKLGLAFYIPRSDISDVVTVAKMGMLNSISMSRWLQWY